MAAKENQHFVPQYYFRYFSNGERYIPMINLSTGKTIEKVSIKGQASKSYFYGDEAAENTITEIEGSFLSALRKLREQKSFSSLSDEEGDLVLMAILFQRSRTLSRRINSKSRNDYMIRSMLEVAINNDGSCSETQRKEFIELLEFVESDPIPFHYLEMQIALTHFSCIKDLRRVILKNITKRDFLFGDAPVAMFNPMQRLVKRHGVLGYRNPGLVIYFPLGPRVAVLLCDPNAYKLDGESSGVLGVRQLVDVDALNKLQMCNAVSAAYFSSYAHAEYVTQLHSAVKKYLSDTERGVFKEGILLSEGGERELIHFYEEQLDFVPKLTFMDYQEVPSHAYLLDRDLWNGKEYF